MLRKLYKRLWPFISPYKGRLIVAGIFNSISSLLGSVTMLSILPVVAIILDEKRTTTGATSTGGSGLGSNQIVNLNGAMKWITDYFISSSREAALLKLCVFIGVVFTLKNLFAYLNNYLMALVEGGMIKNLRDTLFDKLSTLSLDYFFDRKAGHLLSRVTNDVGVVNSTLATSIITLIREPLAILSALYFMFSASTRLTLISFSIAIASMWFINFFGKTIKRFSARVQEDNGGLLTVAQEMISGIKVVKSFGMEQYEVDRFKDETRLHFQSSRRLARIRQLIGPLNEGLAIVGFIGILWFGGQEVFAHHMLGSQLLFFLIALIWLMQPVRALSELSAKLYEGAAAAENVFSVLDAMPTVQPGTLETPTAHVAPIQLQNVHFKYNSATDAALNGINLEIFPNEVIALVGPSGAGKTTLVDLLVRFYDPTKGNIFLNGKNLREYEFTSLRKLFGIVTQDTILFHDTVYNNIAYGNRNATREMVYEAARAANAHEFILQMPNGYETHVGDRGVRLSGGQRQRIAIARALLKNPPILIFDEATSALDTENEMVVQEAIERLLKERTAVVIAHRLSTIQQADRIVVMNDGQIIEIGTHNELLANERGLYHKLYHAQRRAASESVVKLS